MRAGNLEPRDVARTQEPDVPGLNRFFSFWSAAFGSLRLVRAPVFLGPGSWGLYWGAPVFWASSRGLRGGAPVFWPASLLGGFYRGEGRFGGLGSLAGRTNGLLTRELRGRVGTTVKIPRLRRPELAVRLAVRSRAVHDTGNSGAKFREIGIVTVSDSSSANVPHQRIKECGRDPENVTRETARTRSESRIRSGS